MTTRRMTGSLCASFVVVWLCWLVLPLHAQDDANRARIMGAVLDPVDAPVAGITIRLRNLYTGLQREVVSSAAGFYELRQLPPGLYEVRATPAGFSPVVYSSVTLGVGASLRLDFHLTLDEVRTELQVSDTLVNTALASPSIQIPSVAIRDLPINGRRFQDFATLTPGVIVEPGRQQLSFSGQRGVNGNVMLDGADYNQPFFGGIRGGERSNFIMTVPQSAIQEFQVVSSGYAPEYGRSTGGTMNVVTRAGTNLWHGDAFYLNRNNALSAASPITGLTSGESLQQLGGSTGGALKRNRLFFFGAYEQQIADTPRQVDFSVLDGVTPTASTQEAYSYLQSLQKPFNRDNHALASTVRLDWLLRNGSQMTARYNLSRSDETNAVTGGGVVTPLANFALDYEGQEQDRIHFGTLQYTTVLSPRMLNDVKLSVSVEQRPRVPNSTAPAVLIGATSFGSSGPLGSFGGRQYLPAYQDDRRIQVTDSWTYTTNAHSIKLGADLSWLHAFQDFGFNRSGAFVLNSADAVRDLTLLSAAPGQNRFDGSEVQYRLQIGNGLSDYGVRQLAGFAQDTWRVGPTLNLTYGLRWEAQLNPTPPVTNTALARLVQGVVFPNGLSLDPAKIPNQSAQFMPRAGFAWSPQRMRGKLVVRGYGGMFYAATPLLLYAAPMNNFRATPGDVSLVLAPVNGVTVYRQLLAVGVDLNQASLGALPVLSPSTAEQAYALANGTAPNPFAGASVGAFARDFRNPRSTQASLGAESQLSSHWTAGIQFTYINTVHLTRNRDYNLPAPIVRANDASARPYFGLTSGAARPVASLSQIVVRDSSSRAMYRAMTLQTQYRARKLTLGAFYTLAQNYTDDNSERDSSAFQYASAFNLRQEYGPSLLDIRHEFSSYALWTLPHGFDVSGLVRVRSGAPLNAISGSTSLTGDPNAIDRPYTAPGVIMPAYSFRNRGYTNNDLRLTKTFPLRDGHVRLQFTADLFNLFNLDNVQFAGTTNIYGPGVNLDGTRAPVDPRFMLLRLSNGSYNPVNVQAGLPFQAQFGVRVTF